MPNSRANAHVTWSSRSALATLSSRGKRAICLFFALVFMFLAASISAQTPPRPKIYSVAFARFKSSDFALATAFYEKSLGLKPGTDNCKSLSSPCFSINPYQHVELAPATMRDSGSFLEEVGFNVSDATQMKEYLAANGVQTSEVLKAPNGLRFVEASDPEGHLLAFVELSGGDAQINGLYQVSSRLIHAGFIAKDRAVEEKFYRNLLGFRPYWHGGMKDDETSWASLQVPDGSDWLEFMLYDPVGKDKHFLGVMNHIALGVTDIQAAKAQLIKNGFKLTEEPKLGRDGKWQLNVYDPDETRVEFMEFTPKEKPCCSEFTAPHPKP
jgi:catechol 2,3-dioxygenase-like lactoylglutathione lyase family enzyme